MGVKKFKSIVREMLSTKGSSQTTTARGQPIGPKNTDVSVFAMDANCIIYWAAKTVSMELVDKSGAVVKESLIVDAIVDRTVKCIMDMVNALEPDVLLLVLDGVPPIPKVMDQRNRRLVPSENDIYATDGTLLFTTSWICPNSSLMMKLHATLDLLPAQGKISTVYSGPGVPGEGEHKIFLMLQSLCVNGIGEWRPKNIYVFGNDNDLFMLSALFLSTFKRDAPSVFLYDDIGTRKSLAENSTTETLAQQDDSANGIIGINAKTVSCMQFYNIGMFLNCVVGNGVWSAPGSNNVEKMMHFTHLSCFLGNDFVPAMEVGTTTDIVAMFKTILEVARKSEPYIDLATDKSPLEFPLIARDVLPYVHVAVNYNKFMKMAQKLHIAIENNILRITSTTTEPEFAQDKLIALSTAHGISTQLSNSIAFAAACDYIRIMDNVLSYYVSSTCIVPQSVCDIQQKTMPVEYWGYGNFCLPSFMYITAAAQIRYDMTTDNAKNYKHVSAALRKMSISAIEHQKDPEDGTFMSPGFHSAIIFPRRTIMDKNGVIIAQSDENFGAEFLARNERFFPFFPKTTNPEINCTILPKNCLLTLMAFYTVKSEQFVPADIGSAVRKKDGSETTLYQSNYVPDALDV